MNILPPKSVKSDKNIIDVFKEILERDFPLDNKIALQVKNGIVTKKRNV